MATAFMGMHGPDPTDVIGRRFGAWLLDGLVDNMAVVILALAAGIDASDAAQVRGSLTPDYELQEGSLALWFGLIVVYYIGKGCFVGVYGWSVGKLIIGLRVVRWDGRPPGVGRGLARQLLTGIFESLVVFYWFPAFALMLLHRSHRQPVDYMVGTYVVNASYAGQLIIDTGTKMMAGPKSVHRDEAVESLRAKGIDPSTVLTPQLPPGWKPTEPWFDPVRKTHVVWNAGSESWMEFDKKTKSWNPIAVATGPGFDAPPTGMPLGGSFAGPAPTSPSPPPADIAPPNLGGAVAWPPPELAAEPPAPEPAATEQIDWSVNPWEDPKPPNT